MTEPDCLGLVQGRINVGPNLGVCDLQKSLGALSASGVQCADSNLGRVGSRRNLDSLSIGGIALHGPEHKDEQALTGPTDFSGGAAVALAALQPCFWWLRLAAIT